VEVAILVPTPEPPGGVAEREPDRVRPVLAVDWCGEVDHDLLGSWFDEASGVCWPSPVGLGVDQGRLSDVVVAPVVDDELDRVAFWTSPGDDAFGLGADVVRQTLWHRATLSPDTRS
jgi:hypothetical protein